MICSEMSTPRINLSIGKAIPLVLPNNCEWDRRTNECRKISGVKRTSLYIVKEALQIIKLTRNPVCVVAITGPSRTGKSYLLGRVISFMTGRESIWEQRFKLGHKFDPETMGIWMWDTPLDWQNEVGERFSIILLDTEGIDAYNADEKGDSQIFTLSVLLSSLLIYNSTQRPTRDDLEKMIFITNLAKSIVSRGKVLSDTEATQIAPAFFWILRDAMLVPTNSRNEECSFLDFLYEKVLCCPGNMGSDTTQNQARKCLLGFFKSLDAEMLPIPTASKRVLANMDDPKHKKQISPEFLQQVEVVAKKIINKCAPKRGYTRGSVISGYQLGTILDKYICSLNSTGGILDVSSTWEQAVESGYANALASAKSVYCSAMVDQSNLPVEESFLMVYHNKAFKKALAEFESLTSFSSNKDEFRKRLANLKAFIHGTEMETSGRCNGGILDEYFQTNMAASEKQCRNLKDSVLDKHIYPVLRNFKAETPFIRVVNAISIAKTEYDCYSIGPAKGMVWNEAQKFLDSEKARLKTMKDYNEKLLFKQEQIEKTKRELEDEKRKFHQEMQSTIMAQRESVERQMRQLQRRYDIQVRELKQENEQKCQELEVAQTRLAECNAQPDKLYIILLHACRRMSDHY